MTEMSNVETADYIIAHANLPKSGFSWPTDPCGYYQHIKFVNHRNAQWNGGSQAEWEQFVLDYANNLKETSDGA